MTKKCIRFSFHEYQVIARLSEHLIETYRLCRNFFNYYDNMYVYANIALYFYGTSFLYFI